MKVLNLSFSGISLEVFNNRLMPEMTSTNKKIALVAVLVFSFCALLFVVRCFFPKKATLNLPEMVQKKVDLEQAKLPENNPIDEKEIVNEQNESILNPLSQVEAKKTVESNTEDISQLPESIPMKEKEIVKGHFEGPFTDEDSTSNKDLNSGEGVASLDLSGGDKITDVGLINLNKIMNLTSLDLSGCSKITNNGLNSLNTLKNLTSLDPKLFEQIKYDDIKSLMPLPNNLDFTIPIPTIVTDKV